MKWPNFMRKKKRRKATFFYEEDKSSRKQGDWGIERYSHWLVSWFLWKWYPTEKQRDQAFDMLIKHKGYYSEVKIRKIKR